MYSYCTDIPSRRIFSDARSVLEQLCGQKQSPIMTASLQDAIACAKAARVPVVVAVNKIDVEGADPTRVENELMSYDLVPEENGGETLFARVSAREKLGLDDLLDKLLLQADLLDLRANPDRSATGIVVEAGVKKGLGVTATTYVDTRVVTIDTDVYTAYEGYGTTIATNMYGSSKYNTDLNSAVTQVSWLSREEQLRVTLAPTKFSFTSLPPTHTQTHCPLGYSGRSHGRRRQPVRRERSRPHRPDLHHDASDRALEHFVVGDGEGLRDRRQRHRDKLPARHPVVHVRLEPRRRRRQLLPRVLLPARSAHLHVVE